MRKEEKGMKIPVRLKKEEYKYLLEILKNEEGANKADYDQGVDPDGASERLQMLTRIKMAVSYLDRVK
jgi:hypothetical protein